MFTVSHHSFLTGNPPPPPPHTHIRGGAGVDSTGYFSSVAGMASGARVSGSSDMGDFGARSTREEELKAVEGIKQLKENRRRAAQAVAQVLVVGGATVGMMSIDWCVYFRRIEIRLFRVFWRVYKQKYYELINRWDLNSYTVLYACWCCWRKC